MGTHVAQHKLAPDRIPRYVNWDTSWYSPRMKKVMIVYYFASIILVDCANGFWIVTLSTWYIYCQHADLIAFCPNTDWAFHHGQQGTGRINISWEAVCRKTLLDLDSISNDPVPGVSVGQKDDQGKKTIDYCLCRITNMNVGKFCHPLHQFIPCELLLKVRPIQSFFEW